MNPIEWLEHNVPGFSSLPELDRQAIFHFSLLWSLFEAEALGKHASVPEMHTLVSKWEKRVSLTRDPFMKGLDYFRHRYFSNGQETKHLRGLRLGNGDKKKLVYEVLRGNDDDPAHCVFVLLIVVYRLRNNLFHGEKWAFGLREQLNNFTHANAVLMDALSLEKFN